MTNAPELTWEQKLLAIKAIAPGACLEIRKPGDWYVPSSGLWIFSGGLQGGACGHTSGATPELAVEIAWRRLTNLKPGEHLGVEDGDERRYYQWNGFMWSQVRGPQQ